MSKIPEIPEVLNLGLGPALIPMKLYQNQRQQLKNAVAMTGMDISELVVVKDSVMIVEAPKQVRAKRAKKEANATPE